jgi:UDP-glucuronate 4-epimerase
MSAPRAPVLVTGASGFVGLALVEHLLARGDAVVGLDLAPPPPEALEVFAALPGRFDAVGADARDAEALRDAIARFAPDRLLTLAAVTADAARERASPLPIVEVNVGGTIAAIAEAARGGVRRIVHASSGSVYGASGATSTLLREDETPLRPEGLYGISKLAAEQAALRLAALHDLDLVVGRLGTCFGPWEADSGVRDTPSAPLQVLRLAERGEEAVLPRPHPRDWLYVRDAAAGLAALLDAPRPAHRTVNVAAGFVRPLADWCRAISPAFPGWRWRIDPDAANVALYAPYDRAPMDATRLRAGTAFVPRFDLPAAAADFVPWRRRHGATSRVRLHVRPRSV